MGVYMFVWVGALLPKEYEIKVRDICNIHNCDIRLDNVAFSLPQHISLKIAFECKEYIKAVEIIEKTIRGIEPVVVEIIGINKVPSIIWLDIKENVKLRSIHNKLDEVLLHNLNIYPTELDKCFKFHSTLYLDQNEEKLTDMFNLLKEEEFNENPIINSYAIAISKDGRPGTFKIVKILK